MSDIVLNSEGWKSLRRPGYFGRRRDEIIAQLNHEHGVNGWRLHWTVSLHDLTLNEPFNVACRVFYEQAYYTWLRDHPEHVDTICRYSECYDNALSNVNSGTDYTKQESWATHIQDIAVRASLQRLGRRFEGTNDKMLEIRSKSSDGFFLSPGRVPFHAQDWITLPSIKPRWADSGSVEDFWQSNKWIQVRA